MTTSPTSPTAPTIDRYTAGQRQPSTQISTKTNHKVVECYKAFIASIPTTSPSPVIRVRPADVDSYWILWKRLKDYLVQNSPINPEATAVPNFHRWMFYHTVKEQGDIRVTEIIWRDSEPEPTIVSSYCWAVSFARKEWISLEEDQYETLTNGIPVL